VPLKRLKNKKFIPSGAMNLIFDIGNSGTKMAIYDGSKKITSFRSRDFSCEKLEKRLSAFHIDRAIVSSTRTIPEYVVDLLTMQIPYLHILTPDSKLPFRIDYETPETLGTDRIAAAAGAYSLFPGKKTLIIDAGSAITIDFLSGRVFRGGNISPGVSMRFRALHRFTVKLPLVQPQEKYSSPGRNTVEAINAGVINGVVYEINEYIRTFKIKHTGLNVILAGGDGGLIVKKIKHRVTYLPDIVIDGLNFILEYNAK
jgi:type III pantothenate kinase